MRLKKRSEGFVWYKRAQPASPEMRMVTVCMCRTSKGNMLDPCETLPIWFAKISSLPVGYVIEHKSEQFEVVESMIESNR